MPFFGRRGNRYVCAIQSGGGNDALIEIEFSPTPIAEPTMFALPPIGDGKPNVADAQQVRQAAVDAAADASNEFGQPFYLKQIGYVPGDAPHGDMHARCVMEIIRRLVDGGEFKTMEEVEVTQVTLCQSAASEKIASETVATKSGVPDSATQDKANRYTFWRRFNWNPFVVAVPFIYLWHSAYRFEFPWFRTAAACFVSVWFLGALYDFMSGHRLLDWMYSDDE